MIALTWLPASILSECTLVVQGLGVNAVAKACSVSWQRLLDRVLTIIWPVIWQLRFELRLDLRLDLRRNLRLGLHPGLLILSVSTCSVQGVDIDASRVRGWE